MVKPVVLYVSAATDLQGEREIVGRAVTELPVDLPWRITQSPHGNQSLDTEALLQADLHLLLLGNDIRAPVGLEWLTAKRAGRLPLPYLKRDALRTPAALEFIRYVQADREWRRFKDGTELRREVLLLLANHVLEQALSYRLSPVDVERLRTWRAGLKSSTLSEDETTRGGAGESGIILSKERYLPSEGIPIEPDEAQRGKR